MTFAEAYEKFGRTDEDRKNDIIETKDEDVLYDIKDDEPQIPPIPKDSNNSDKPGHIDHIDPKMSEMFEQFIKFMEAQKGGESDGN